MLFVDPSKLNGMPESRGLANRFDRPEMVVMLGVPAWLSTPLEAPCPVCKGRIRETDSSLYCGRCDRAGSGLEARLARRRGEAECRTAWTLSQNDQIERLIDEWGGELTERQRRRIWHGLPDWKGGTVAYDTSEPVSSKPSTGFYNPAALGRAYLRASGQEPDWGLAIDHAGAVIGRWQDGRIVPIKAPGVRKATKAKPVKPRNSARDMLDELRRQVGLKSRRGVG